FGLESFHYGSPVLLARHRMGFGDRLTLGYRFEGGFSLASGGPTLAWALPVGELDLGAAASVDGPSPGAAGSLVYSLSSQRFSAAVSLRAMTDHYANSALPREMDRARLQAQGNLSATIVPGLGL